MVDPDIAIIKELIAGLERVLDGSAPAQTMAALNYVVGKRLWMFFEDGSSQRHAADYFHERVLSILAQQDQARRAWNESKATKATLQ